MNILSSTIVKGENKKDSKTEHAKEFDQLNLFNSDGSRCSIDEILNS
jgi:hypothetical protein